MPHAYFFLSSLAWNLGLGMTWLAVPLAAYSQGLSNAQIGILFAAPVFAQAPLNLVGGAYTDRIGVRRILLGSAVATIAAGLWLMAAHGFWMLLIGRLPHTGDKVYWEDWCLEIVDMDGRRIDKVLASPPKAPKGDRPLVEGQTT